jgi:hypothetical protein
MMPYTKKKRPYKKEYEQQKKRGEHADQTKTRTAKPTSERARM